MGLGFSHTPGRYRPGGCAFSSPRFLGCIYMGDFLTRRWEIILPVFSETSALDARAPLTSRWLHEPRAISNHQVGLGFPHTPGGYRGKLTSTYAAGPRRWTEGQQSPRAGSMNPGKIAITKWDWGLDALRDSIDPGNVGFRTRVY